jgi:hypothetical protein
VVSSTLTRSTKIKGQNCMAREKHVYPTNEIAHLWAHQSKPDARNPQSNFYFRGDTIYSYGSHFPIARHIEHDGKKAVLFTSRTYSNTTAKHVHNTRGSIPRGVPVFEVDDVRQNPTDSYKDKRKDVDEQIARLRLARPENKYQLRVKTTKGKLTWKYKGEDREADAVLGKRLAMNPSGNVVYRVNKTLYNITLRAGKNAGITVIQSLSRAEARIVLDILDSVPQKHWDNFEDNRAKLAKKVDAAREVARKQTSISRNPGSLAKAFNKLQTTVVDLNAFAQFFGGDQVTVPDELSFLADIAAQHEERMEVASSRAAATRVRKWRQREEDAKLKFEEKLPRWLAGEDVYLGYVPNIGTDYLRSRRGEVETTRGARVPLDHVKKALPLVLSYVTNGREFKPNGHTIRLGYYTVSGIDADGTLTVGCHRFSKAEILRFAGVLDSLEGSVPSGSAAPDFSGEATQQ